MESIYHLLDVPAGKKDELHRALTTVQGLSGWWTSKTEEPEKGLYRFHFGGGYHKDFKVLKAGADKHVWECVEGHPEWVGTRLSFEMQTDGEKRQVHFRHSAWKEQMPMFGICSYHWALYMKSLKDLVETGKGQPTEVKDQNT